MKRLGDPVRIVLLAIFTLLSITSLVQKSPTFDEPYHLYQGYRFLKTGDPSLWMPKHPPGVQALAALPMLIPNYPLPDHDARDPRSYAEMNVDIRRFFEQNGGAPLRMFFLSRIVIVLLAASLGSLVYSGARDLYGKSGARLALFMFSFDPNLIAHGQLVTTDLGAALGAWICVLLLLRWAREPSVKRALLLGMALGLALLAKFSMVLLLAWLPVLGLFLAHGRGRHPGLMQAIRHGALALAAALAIVWTLYGFEIGTLADVRRALDAAKGRASHVPELARPPGGEGEESEQFTGNEGVVARVPLFAPSYFFGLRQNVQHVYRRGHPTYFRGEHSMHGSKLYFPYIFAVKTPIPTLLLILFAFASFVLRRPSREELVILAVPILYMSSAVAGSLNIGYRHILPIVPFLFVLCGRLTVVSIPRVVLATLLGLLALGTLASHPHYLAYFNRIAGGSSQGIRHAVGADLDWGQDLPALAAWLERNGIEEVELSYFGRVDPSYYGIEWESIALRAGVTAESIPPGVYAVSASRLVELQSLGQGQLKIFQELEPKAVIGHSIYVYVVEGPKS